jgi:hypothetical protein
MPGTHLLRRAAVACTAALLAATVAAAPALAADKSLGPSASQALYLTREAGDNTHFSAQGGAEMAGLVVQGVRELNLPLAGYLR